MARKCPAPTMVHICSERAKCTSTVVRSKLMLGKQQLNSFDFTESVGHECVSRHSTAACSTNFWVILISCDRIYANGMQFLHRIQSGPVATKTRTIKSQLSLGINFYWSHTILGAAANNAVIGPIPPTNSWRGFLYGHKAVNSFVCNAQWITYMCFRLPVPIRLTLFIQRFFCLSFRPYLLFHSTHTVHIRFHRRKDCVYFEPTHSIGRTLNPETAGYRMIFCIHRTHWYVSDCSMCQSKQREMENEI